MKRLLPLTIAAAALLWMPVSTPAARANAGDAPKAWAQGQAAQQEQRPQDQGKTQTFSGTITKSGEDFTLTDKERGINYKLDDVQKAGQFEGKTVKVTGTVDAEGQIIHVETIQEAS
jgi:hypothetical protein